MHDNSYDVTTLQISTMIGWKSASNSEEEKREKGFSQSGYSMLRRYCVEQKRSGVIAKCSEVKCGSSWQKLAFSYDWIFSPVKERDAFPIQLHDVLFSGEIAKKSTISWTV